MTLEPLKELDGLIEGAVGRLACYIHVDHRWLLPIILYAQEQGRLPKPVTLVMFDFHHDCLAPSPGAMAEIRRLRQVGPTVPDLIRLCAERLAKSDDDWVLAGMQLGLIGDAVIFGVSSSLGHHDLTNYTDHTHLVHRIELIGELPGEALRPRGALADLAKPDAFGRLWEILGWRPGQGFQRGNDVPPILLDIDLDTFMIRYNGPEFPWPDLKFEQEFLAEAEGGHCIGWSGKEVVQGLLAKAGLFTIAQEPECCGNSQENCDELLGKVNYYLLSNQLRLNDQPKPLWWGFVDRHGVLGVRVFTSQRVIDQARAVPGIREIHGPFEAIDKRDAMMALLAIVYEAAQAEQN